MAAPVVDDFFCDFQGFQSATTTSAPAFPPAVASAQPVQLPPGTGNGIGDVNFMLPSFTTSPSPPPTSSTAAPLVQAYTAPPSDQLSTSFDPFAVFGNLNAAPPAGAPVLVATSETVTSPPPQSQAIPNSQITIPDPLDIFK